MMIFENRDAAGRALADEIAQRIPRPAGRDRPLVLALPRGGVPVARPVAERIGAELDIIIVRKIGAPAMPELGVGAIAEDGPPVFDPTALEYLGLTEDDLAATVAAERAELARRSHRYRGDRPTPQVAGRTVVLIDDGLATGVTAHAALRWLRKRQPQRLILAVPVCSPQARDLLATDTDTVVCLYAPEPFSAVGQWYIEFGQLTDADVDESLSRAQRAAAG